MIAAVPLNVQACVDCRELISPHAYTCPKCGCPLRKPPDIESPSEATFSRSVWSIISGGIGTLGLIYFGFYFNTTVADGATRIHNVGLMNDRLVGVIVFAAIAIRAWFPDRLRFATATKHP